MRLNRKLDFVSDPGLAGLLGTALLHASHNEERNLLCNPLVICIRERIWNPATDWSGWEKLCEDGYHSKLATSRATWANHGSQEKINFNISLPSAISVGSSPHPPSIDVHDGPGFPPPGSPYGPARLDDMEELNKFEPLVGPYNRGNANRQGQIERSDGVGNAPTGIQRRVDMDQPYDDESSADRSRQVLSRSPPSALQSTPDSSPSGRAPASPSTSLSGRRMRAGRWGRNAMEAARSAGSRMSPSRLSSPRHPNTSPRSNTVVSNWVTPPPSYADAVRGITGYFSPRRNTPATRSPLRNMMSSLSISTQPSTPRRREATVPYRNLGDSSIGSASVDLPSQGVSATANQSESVPSEVHCRPTSNRLVSAPSQRAEMPATTLDQENAPFASRETRRSQRLKTTTTQSRAREMGHIPIQGRPVLRDSMSLENLRTNIGPV